MSAILGVYNDITNSNYLGLPSLIGRSKKRVFGFLKERVNRRIDGWKAKPISRAGKAVLIKNVAQALPSYCMTCFMLPTSLLLEIERIFNAYWWNSGSTGSRGIRWLSWEAMSVAKCRGGMGFRNLHGFNVSMLGKHIWKCIQDPQLLVSRVLRARYFPDVSILEARKGVKPSFIWTSIWQAKESLASGFHWVIGDGHSVVATRDAWLALKPNHKVDNLQMYERRNETVSTLFQAGTKFWDSIKIRELFSEGDANAILATSVPQRQVVDRIVWSKSINGIYNVKTGYREWQNHLNENSRSIQSRGWSHLWRLAIPSKIKIFVWRLCRDNLPVKSRLREKGVDIPNTCPMCDADIENSMHLFFGCQYATGCWDAVHLKHDLGEVTSASQWVLCQLETAKNEELMNMCVVLWGIWYWRNKKVWSNQTISPGVAMDNSFAILRDWKAARQKVQRGNGGTEGGSVRDRKWKTPEPGTLKLNVDAAFKTEDSTFSIGMVIRDHEGVFVEGRVMKLARPSSVFEAECIGVREALSWLQSYREWRVVVETDSLLTAGALGTECNNLLEVGHVVDQCKTLLHGLPGVCITHVRKQANKVAHSLARIPCLLNCFIIFSSPPTHLVETILSDLC